MCFATYLNALSLNQCSFEQFFIMAMVIEGTVGTPSSAKIEWGGFPTIFNGAKNFYESCKILLMRHLQETQTVWSIESTNASFKIKASYSLTD